MDGYAEARHAARSAIALLRHQPIMAEDFGAKPYSSQLACLEGVEASDTFLLILGGRYGHVAKSKVSVVEEEFALARTRGLPVLIFVEDVELEPRQSAFLATLKSYEEGYHFAKFSNPAELSQSIIRALNDLNTFSANAIDVIQAENLLTREDWGAEGHDHDPWLGLVVFPAVTKNYVSHRELAGRPFRDQIIQKAAFGENSFFDLAGGVSHEEGEDHLLIRQGAKRRRGGGARIKVTTDGVISIGTTLSVDDDSPYSIVRSTVIDEDRVAQSLDNMVALANWYFGNLKDCSNVNSYYLGGSLSGVASKAFGRIPKIQTNGMQMPMHSLGGRVCFPKSISAFSRAQLVDSRSTSADLVDFLRRKFRAANAYYTPERSRF